jgi:hypothetical protein
MRLEGESIAFDWAIEPPEAAGASVLLEVVDSLGGAVHNDSYSQAVEAGATQGGYLTFPHGLADGDYAVWVRIMVGLSGDRHTEGVEGISVIVARGRAYPSREAVAAPDDWSTSFRVDNGRIDGRWFLADVTNHEAHTITVVYTVTLTSPAGVVDTAHGDEAVGAGSTQQLHYLLPDQLDDGEYIVFVSVHPAGTGTDFGLAGSAAFSVADNQVTVHS